MLYARGASWTDELRRSYVILTQGLNADFGEYEGPESLRRAAALLDLQVVIVQRPLVWSAWASRNSIDDDVQRSWRRSAAASRYSAKVAVGPA